MMRGFLLSPMGTLLLTKRVKGGGRVIKEGGRWKRGGYKGV